MKVSTYVIQEKWRTLVLMFSFYATTYIFAHILGWLFGFYEANHDFDKTDNVKIYEVLIIIPALK